MWTHEVQLCGVVVAGHEQVRLVFVGRWVRSGGLRRSRQPLEVELVCVPLPVHLGHDVLVVVIPAQRWRQPALLKAGLNLIGQSKVPERASVVK